MEGQVVWIWVPMVGWPAFNNSRSLLRRMLVASNIWFNVWCSFYEHFHPKYMKMSEVGMSEVGRKLNDLIDLLICSFVNLLRL